VSAPDWRAQAKLNGGLQKTTQTLGLFVADVDGRAQVNVFDDTIEARYATRYKPRPGEGVVLTFFGNQVRVTGPTASKNRLGKVTAVAHPYLTITCDGRTYKNMPYTVSYQSAGPKVGDTVAIDWDKGYVEDAVTADPVDAAVTPKLTTNQEDFKVYVFARQSGSFETEKNRWVTRDLYCGSKYSAGWFYGSAIRDKLRDDAYISSVEIFLSLRTKKGDHPKIGHHSDASEHTGGVSVYDGVTRDWTGWVPLPVAWANTWRTELGGVSISGGDSIYRGIGTDRQSGKLRIRGRQ
jgi:hypothetical protein